MDVKETYKRRFSTETSFRNAMWSLLCREYFQNWISEDARILEIAAGYCEFINHIKAGKKIALDINPDVQQYANPDVEVILSESENITMLSDDSIDVVFVSNFFEHITKTAITRTLKEIFRILTPKGRLIILQPNIRFCLKDYWMFFDHITPIDDRALVEILELTKFQMVKVIPRFLPYSTKSSLPKSLQLIKYYLKLPILWRFFGQQALIVCDKN